VRIQLGDLATWVGAIITIGVLSVAVWQLEMLRRDRESQQAALVSAWVSASPVGFPDPTDPDPTKTVEVSFRNASTQPIGRVLFQVTSGTSRQRTSVGPLPPDGTIKTKKVVFSAIPLSDANSPNQLDIWFIDEAGHQWNRPHGGRLREAGAPHDWRELGLAIGRPQKKAGGATTAPDVGL
jgi:hypothetical protein